MASLYFFPAILNAVVFGFYIGFGNELSLDIAFAVITLLNIIRNPLAWFPDFFGQFLEFRVSMKRIAKFLCCDEVNASIIRHVGHETPNSVEITEGSNFHWGVKPQSEQASEDNETSPAKTIQDYLALKNFGLQIKRGEFVCVIGDVGAGKTSLLQSIVGDLLYASPEFVNGLNPGADIDSLLLAHS